MILAPSPAAYEELPLNCPGCGHKFTRQCSIIDEEIILEDDICPICGVQAELD